MRIVFAGTPAPALPVLRALIDSEHEIAAVLTRPPARSGRGRALVPSPVAALAAQAGLPLIEASGFANEELRERLRRLDADLGVVVAYGALIPREVLDMPAQGWINLHFSDLPRWRGAAPVQWAILAGDEETASTVFALEEGLDSGPVYSRLPLRIGHETSGELLARMAELGAPQVLEVVNAIAAGTASARPQDESDPGASKARRLTHEDGFVTFEEDASMTDRRIRAVTPNPGAWTLLPSGQRLKLDAAEPVEAPGLAPGVVAASKTEVLVGCRAGALRLGRVAPAGKGWMDAAAWARGARLPEGARLGGGGESR